MTVANAASAQAAYGVSVTFALPPGVAAAALRATPGPGSAGPALHCDVSALTCTGTLPAGTSRQITLTGPVPAAARPGDTYSVRARASVTGTTAIFTLAVTHAPIATPVPPHPATDPGTRPQAPHF